MKPGIEKLLHPGFKAALGEFFAWNPSMMTSWDWLTNSLRVSIQIQYFEASFYIIKEDIEDDKFEEMFNRVRSTCQELIDKYQLLPGVEFVDLPPLPAVLAAPYGWKSFHMSKEMLDDMLSYPPITQPIRSTPAGPVGIWVHAQSYADIA